MQKKIFLFIVCCLCAIQTMAATLTFDSDANGLSLGGGMKWNGTGGGHLYCEYYNDNDWITFSSPTYVTSFQMNYMPWQGYTGGSGSSITIKAFNASSQEIWSSVQDLSSYKSWSSWKTVTVNTANVTQLMFYATNGFWPSIDNMVINTVVASPALSASNTNFGNVRVGSSATASVTVTNTGTSGSTLTGNIGPASGSEFSPASGSQSFSLSQNQSASRTYTYTPSARGADSTTVSVTSNATNTNLTLTGTGVSPVYASSVAPGSTIDFGTVDKDQTITQALTIQNATPDADLGNLTNMTLLSATISGQDASYFSISGFTPGTVLSKNGSFQFFVSVSNPDYYIMNRYATLTIVTDVNAALGVAGNVYTYQLVAYTVPEPSSIIFLSVAGLFLMISRFSRKSLHF